MTISSAPKACKVFVSHPRAGRRAVLAIQTAHLPYAKSPFWWVTFREQTWVTSRERRRAIAARPSPRKPYHRAEASPIEAEAEECVRL